MKVKVESEKVGLKLNIQKMKIMASGPITSWEQMGKQWKQCQTLFFWAPKSLQMVTTAMKLKDTPWKESYDQLRWHIEKQTLLCQQRSIQLRLWFFLWSRMDVRVGL